MCSATVAKCQVRYMQAGLPGYARRAPHALHCHLLCPLPYKQVTTLQRQLADAGTASGQLQAGILAADDARSRQVRFVSFALYCTGYQHLLQRLQQGGSERVPSSSQPASASSEQWGCGSRGPPWQRHALQGAHAFAQSMVLLVHAL